MLESNLKESLLESHEKETNDTQKPTKEELRLLDTHEKDVEEVHEI